jgi:membrane-associated phospholipid phosphatase
MRAFVHTLGSVLLASFLGSVLPAYAQQAPESTPDDPVAMPSVGSLFTSLPADVGRLPTVANGLWLGGAGAVSFAVHKEDVLLTRKAVASLRLDTFFEIGAVTGGGWVQVGGALGTYVAGRIAHHREVAVLGVDLVRAQLVNTLLTQGLKVAVNRSRPDGRPHSFPSGHSSASFATATVLARHFGWRAGVPAYAMATYIAGSRLQENHHYLSDVIFGAGVGIVSGRAVTVGRGSGTFAVSPAALPGGIGVNFTRIGNGWTAP